MVEEAVVVVVMVVLEVSNHFFRDVGQWAFFFLLIWLINAIFGRYQLLFKIVVFFNVGIKSIFDFVLWPSWKVFADFRPLASNLTVKLKKLSIFCLSPFLAFDSRVEFVDEPLPDLFACFSFENFG